MGGSRGDPIPTSLVGSYAQPDWLIDRERLRDRFPPRVRAHGAVARRPALPRGGAGRRDAAGDRRPGARRAGHHHRRRDAPGELLQPLRDRARRRRHRQPGHRAGPQRATRTRCRAWSGRSPAAHPVQVRDLRVPAGAHEPHDQDHRPGPFTMSQQAQDDHYGAPDELGDGIRRRGARGDPRPVRRRRGHRAGRRAVHAGAARGGARVRPRRAQARHRRHRRHDRRAHLLRLRRDHPRAARAATRSCPSWPRPSATRSASRPRSPGSTLDVLDALAAKTIILGVIDLSTDEVETPETVADRIRRAFPPRRPRAADRRARLRHEVPPARRRLRQAGGARRGRAARRRLEHVANDAAVGSQCGAVDRPRPVAGDKVTKSAISRGVISRASSGGRALLAGEARAPPRGTPARGMRSRSWRRGRPSASSRACTALTVTAEPRVSSARMRDAESCIALVAL